MSPFIEKLAKELGKTDEEVVDAWESAKIVTADTFGIDKSDFTLREIEYTKEIVREKLGMNRLISVSDFVNSDKSARDFIDEIVSGPQSSDSFGINNTIIKDDDEEDEMDEGCTTKKKKESDDEDEDDELKEPEEKDDGDNNKE